MVFLVFKGRSVIVLNPNFKVIGSSRGLGLGRFFVENGGTGAEFAARASPKHGSGGITVDGQFKEFREDFLVGFTGAIVKLVVEVLAEGLGADAQREGDLIVRDAEFGEFNDFRSLNVGEPQKRTTAGFSGRG